MRHYLAAFAFLPALLLSPFVLANKVQVEVLQDRLDHPWSLAFLPEDQGLLITERSGQLRRWQAGKGLSPAIAGVPDVWSQRQGDYWMWCWPRTLPAADVSGSVIP